LEEGGLEWKRRRVVLCGDSRIVMVSGVWRRVVVSGEFRVVVSGEARRRGG
jgi:hypothetical protein